MQFRFNANEEYQIRAVESITELFDGQPRIEVDLSLAPSGLAVVPNRLDLEDETILNNLRGVQADNHISPDSALACIEETITNGEGDKVCTFPNFAIEMETGTGKTYVYIRTALELYRRYGFRKYIVVVPSVAIREGVLKTLQVTAKHFRELYGNIPFRYGVYDSASLSQLRQFALSDSVEILIMTIDSFNKAMKEDGKGNVIHRPTDRLQGETPIHLVQATKPVLILDEPQNMESEKSIAALAALDPLFALRYSATHRNPYNVVYRLTPFEAYRQGLVKKIQVASVVKEDDIGQVFLRLDGIASQKNTLTARIAVHKLMKNGAVKEQVLTVKPGDELGKLTGIADYESFDVDEIDVGEGFVRFANDVELRNGESRGADKEAIFDAQIRYTIREHFKKQHSRRGDGVKVLSLFFIDRVENYASEDGIIRKLFNKAFDEIKQEFAEWADVESKAVQAAYFAQKKRKGGEVEVLESVSGKTKEDEAAYDLIMKDKERLLSFDEPVCFLFSHSALREGWDNPNVFQICTLNQSASEARKRQEVGRGVRLAVDQAGDRVRDDRVNVLTVIANESYKDFVTSLQSDIALDYRAEIEARYHKSIDKMTKAERARIAEEYGEGILPPRPPDARKEVTVKPRKEFFAKDEFRELWARIQRKTRYSVHLDTAKLVDEVVDALAGIEVKPPRVTITKARVEVGSENTFEALQMSAAKTVTDLAGRFPLPNVVDVMASLMEFTTPRVKLTRKTLLDIFRRTPNQAAAMENPQEFAQQSVAIIKSKLADHLVTGVHYEQTGEVYVQTLLEEDLQTWTDYIVPAAKCPHSLYRGVICDSNIERSFVAGLEELDFVKLYVKLPAKFIVPTPIGDYNPDWAIVCENRNEYGESDGCLLYLVRETKGTTAIDALKPDERRRTTCGEKHFRDCLGVGFKVVSKASELL